MSTENFAELEGGHSKPSSGPIERSYFSGSVNYMIFGALGEHYIHVCESFLSGKNLLSMFDTSVVTACGNVDSTLREEPPKTVIFDPRAMIAHAT